MDGFILRPYDPDRDEGFCLVSWVAEAVKSPTYEHLDGDLAFALIRPHVLAHLDDPLNTALVCCPTDSRDTIVGFIVSAAPILLHLHVKRRFRGLGLARSMLAHTGLLDAQTVIAATDTRDLRALIASGRPIVLRPDLLPLQVPRNR